MGAWGRYRLLAFDGQIELRVLNPRRLQVDFESGILVFLSGSL